MKTTLKIFLCGIFKQGSSLTKIVQLEKIKMIVKYDGLVVNQKFSNTFFMSLLLKFIWSSSPKPKCRNSNKSQRPNTCVPYWALMFKPMSKGGRYNINQYLIAS